MVWPAVLKTCGVVQLEDGSVPTMHSVLPMRGIVLLCITGRRHDHSNCDSDRRRQRQQRFRYLLIEAGAHEGRSTTVLSRPTHGSCIDPHMGLITTRLTNAMDREVQPIYHIIVQARDRGSPPMSGQSGIGLTIIIAYIRSVWNRFNCLYIETLMLTVLTRRFYYLKTENCLRPRFCLMAAAAHSDCVTNTLTYLLTCS